MSETLSRRITREEEGQGQALLDSAILLVRQGLYVVAERASG
jgi:hypothetical protein